MIPCPTCGCNCTIGSDPLTADTDFTLDGPSISGGTLTASGAGTAFYTPAPASNRDAVKLTVLATNAAASGVAKLVAGRFDDDNYAFGRLTLAAGVGTLQCGVVVGGTQTLLGEAVTVEDTGTELEDEHPLSLCFEPGEEVDPESFEATQYPTIINGTGWTDIDNARLDDGNTAIYTFTATTETATLSASGFGFGAIVPPGSTIDGIEVGVSAWHQTEEGGPIDLYAQLFDQTGLVGDVKGPVVLDQTSGAEHGFGGAADTWSAGLVAADVLGVEFGVLVTFDKTGGGFTEDLAVDWISITLHFTTPAGTRGKLRFTYGNSGSATVDCALTYDLFVEELGTGTGLIVESGDWTFAAPYLLEYAESESRPSCPTCECGAGTCETDDCTSGTFPPNVITIGDLGGYTDGVLSSDCGFNACAAVDGFFVLTRFGVGSGECSWGFTSVGECPNDATDNWHYNVHLQLLDGVFVAYVTVEFGGGFTALRSTWRYESGAIIDNDCTLPIMLNRIEEIVGAACGGSPPATLTIDEP